MRILYLSYFYPPLGGPASLRNVKTVKYLTELGAVVDVISVGDIEYNFHDVSLLAQAKEHSLTRTASYDPMALMKKLLGKHEGASQSLYSKTPERIKLLIRRMYPLDDKIGWLPPLIKAGAKALQQDRYDLIYVSCGPFSSSLAAWWLSKRFHVPYAVEMRDYWTLLSDYNLMGSAVQRGFARYWEARILHGAKWVVTATKGIGTDLAAAFGEELRAKLFTLYNGHDEEDYADLKPVHKQEAGFVFSYFGALYARRSLKCFYAAIRQLAEEGALPPGTQIRLYGNYNLEAVQEAEDSGISIKSPARLRNSDLPVGKASLPLAGSDQSGCTLSPKGTSAGLSCGDTGIPGSWVTLQMIPSLSHKEALHHMAASDALILVINSSSPQGTLTSKVFEYLRTGKPILAMVPSTGEAAELLQESGQNYICAMESVSSIKACIIRLLADKQHASRYDAERYSRKAQVQALYRLLDIM